MDRRTALKGMAATPLVASLPVGEQGGVKVLAAFADDRPGAPWHVLIADSEKPYAAGKWILATMFDDTDAQTWCRDRGLLQDQDG